MIWVTTAGRPSNSAKLLASQPGFKRAFKCKKIKPDDYLINWGSSKQVNFRYYRLLNNFDSVTKAANKLTTFQIFKESLLDCVIPWTTQKAVAQDWSDSKSTVVARTKLTGHSGDGIIVVEPGNEVPEAPLYTKYIFKKKEFRVHVVGAKVIDTQQKIKDPNQEVKTWKIRSHENGFIFARNNITEDLKRDEIAILAIANLDLDFGAVDIIQDKNGKYYILEVNTAPGLEGQTVTNYAEAFREICR